MTLALHGNLIIIRLCSITSIATERTMATAKAQENRIARLTVLIDPNKKAVAL
jgi:hypothetical protein